MKKSCAVKVPFVVTKKVHIFLCGSGRLGLPLRNNFEDNLDVNFQRSAAEERASEAQSTASHTLLLLLLTLIAVASSALTSESATIIVMMAGYGITLFSSFYSYKLLITLPSTEIKSRNN